MADLLQVGISGLKAHQTALTVTGHNITNAGTEGYSRQEVNFTENNPQFNGGVWVGNGVSVASVRRVYDEFLNEQLRRDTSTFNEFETLATNAGQIDSLLADPGTGVQPGLERFFGALQSTVDDPSSLPAREVLISEAQGLADRFSSISDRLVEQNQVINGQMEVIAGQISTIAEAIAELNEQIQFATASAQGNEPNDLLDQRSQLLKDLSELVEVNVVQQDNAGLNVFIGNGQALVIGNDYNEMFASNGEGDPSRFDIYFRKGDVIQNISREITGGQLGGTLDFRREVLDPTLNGLGRTALAITQTFNEQHRLGIDYDGLKGENFFESVNDPVKAYSRVFGSANNADPDDRVLSVQITNSNDLTTSDYKLTFPGPDDQTFRITRLSDNELLTTQTLSGEFPQSIEVEGFEIRLEGGSFQHGDEFLIMPTRMGSSQVEMNITRAEQVALASPISTDAAIGNRGSATISPGVVYDSETRYLANEGELDPPILIRFTSPTTYDVLDNTDPGNPIPLFPPLMNQSYTPGITNSILPRDEGKTAFTSFGGVLPSSTLYQAPLPAPVLDATNGFFPERINISNSIPETGFLQQQPTLITRENASAKEIAAELSKREGVEASARTTVELTDFSQDSNPFLPLRLSMNGIDLTDTLGPNQTKYDADYPATVPEPITPNFLADRINANRELQDLGIVARSDGGTLTVIALNGDDLDFEITGDTGDGFAVSNGHDVSLKATGENPFTLLNEVDGYDFSVGGPYTYEFEVPGQGTFNLELTDTYADGDELLAGIKAVIEASGVVLPGNIDVEITEKGNIQFQNRLDMRATGVNGSSKIAMGGQVKVITDPNFSLEISPPGNNIFPENPVGEPVHFGFDIDIEGLVQSGDEFTISFNEDGTSDSRNGGALTALQTADTISGNTSYSESYARLVERIGSVTSRAQINRDSSDVLLNNTQNSVSSNSGVNLDEEASRLIQFELAYNASAQVIQVARDVFDTLIGTFR
ncbi:flagellar hook-associated protein FlgK [Bacterioplanoides sp. SCSIO 12839]|uniref:flagellar hook-associated protein FlgK n=1 Tax=Bacterioplanoides sp. SCSIO 12839 TaxID=2829569 RepID=UPI0021073846|nr:flagellar hook-associated protein FlgK [Bacterioplanoides sp. SCSIO 12839]UTW47300.1 flagellar hook-associated protein FlgK [Bacterioplanoides sp. SCSIO 12839]